MSLPGSDISQISIIIPTLNEGNTIKKTLAGLINIPDTEIIVVDGGSRDDTREQVVSFGIQIISQPAHRALQMNAGAAASHGDILLFLHADTTLPHNFADSIRRALSTPYIVGGAFRLAINASGFTLRAVEWMVNRRSLLFQMPYGDQALFVTSDMFQAIGGYPAIAIMEDLEFIRKLRKKGRIHILSQPATTSARRWRQLGVVKTTLTNQLIILGYLLGINPDRLAAWYNTRKKR